MEYICRYLTEFWNIYRHATITDGYFVCDYRWKYKRNDSVGTILAGNYFFCRASPSVRPSVFRRWLVFLFPIESATEWEITEDQYFDGQIPSVRPSGKMLMTDFVPYTNGINPSVKLFNGVVYDQIWKSHILYFFLRFGRLLIYIYMDKHYNNGWGVIEKFTIYKGLEFELFF